MPANNPSIEIRQVATALTRNAITLRGARHHLLVTREFDGALVAAGATQPLTGAGVTWLPRGTLGDIVIDAGSRCTLLSVDDAVVTRAIAGDALAGLVRQVIAETWHRAALERAVLDRLDGLLALLDDELGGNLPGLESITANTLATILVMLWRLSGAAAQRPLAPPRDLLYRFNALLEVHLRDHWSVGRYAARLGVSRERLTAVVKRATGKSPLVLIHDRLLDEARILLTATHQQVAEVAYQLGFSDPAYFNRFFQRHQGTTPARFRREQQHAAPRDADSFAAWP